jgi:hypothetical protein
VEREGEGRGVTAVEIKKKVVAVGGAAAVPGAKLVPAVAATPRLRLGWEEGTHRRRL